MMAHMIADIIDRHCGQALTLRERDGLVQEILNRVDENFLVLPKDHKLALMVQANTESSEHR